MPPRAALGQLGGAKGTLPRGKEVSKAEKKRRKTSQLLKKEAGKGPSDSRFNVSFMTSNGRVTFATSHKENR